MRRNIFTSVVVRFYPREDANEVVVILINRNLTQYDTVWRINDSKANLFRKINP